MKLIILNGIAGAGKTTVAKRLHDALPLSVLIPNFEVRRMISHFKTNRDLSRTILFNLTYGLTEQGLRSGSHVIVDSKIHDDLTGKSIIDRLVELAKTLNAETYEVLLEVDKKRSIQRIRSRGFSKGAILTEENVEENVENFIHQMEEFKKTRRNALAIDTSTLSPDEVFSSVCRAIHVQG
jgi:broad-specificity NMP kinase